MHTPPLDDIHEQDWKRFNIYKCQEETAIVVILQKLVTGKKFYVHIATSVVPINQITIRNSRLLGNFVTIGIGRFLRLQYQFIKIK